MRGNVRRRGEKTGYAATRVGVLLPLKTKRKSVAAVLKMLLNLKLKRKAD